MRKRGAGHRFLTGAALRESYLPMAVRGISLPDQRRGGTQAPVILCLAAILGIGLLLRTQHLSDLTMHFDECCSWKIGQFPWSEMIDAVARDAHPPLYYVLMKGMGLLGASSPLAVRGFSVFFGMATILAAFWFVRTARAGPACLSGTEPGRRDACTTSTGDIPQGTSPGKPGEAGLAAAHGVCDLHSEPAAARTGAGDRDFAAVLAAALVAGSAMHVEMSLQARPYTLGTFLTLVSATFLLRATRQAATPRLRFGLVCAVDWMGFAVTATMLSLTHYYALFTVAAELLFAVGLVLSELWRCGWSTRAKRLLAGFGLSAWGMQLVWSTWLPVFLFQRERSTPQLWMSPLDWSGFCANCWMALAGGQSSVVPPDWAWLAVAAWIGGVLSLFICGNQASRLAALCAGFPLAATVAYCLAVRNILGAKYLIFGQTFLLVATALLVARLRWLPVRLILAAGLLSWSGYWCWQHAATREYQASFPGVRGAVAYLDEKRLADEPVIVGSPFVSIIVQRYTAHAEGIYVRYGGDHRRDMLGGPPLREQEYQDVESRLATAGRRVWTVDVFELFGPTSKFECNLPREWTLVGQKEFREAYGMPCILAIREHRRRKPDEGEGTP